MKDLSDFEAHLTGLNKNIERLVQQARFDEALESSEAVLQTAGISNFPEMLAIAHRNRGIAFTGKSMFTFAEREFHHALDNFQKFQDLKGIMHSYSNLATVKSDMLLFEEAINYYSLALDLSIELNDGETQSEIFNNFGILYKRLGNTEKAIEYYEKSLIFKKSVNNKKAMAIVYNNIGNVYTATDNTEMALEYYTKCYDIWEEEDFLHGLTFVLNNLAYCHIQKANYSVALEFLERALLLSKQLSLNTNIIINLTNMGKLFLKIRKLDNAKEFLDEALEMSESFGNADQKIAVLENYIELFLAEEEYKKAYEYQKKISEISSEYMNMEQSQKISEMQAQFEYEQKERETQLYKKKNQELEVAYKLIENQSQELADSNALLQELDKSKDKALGIISHDLKNTLGSINSLVDLLNLESLSDKVTQMLNMIALSSERAMQLVSSILEAYKMDSEGFVLEMQKSEIAEILEEFIEPIASLTLNKKISLSHDFCQEILYVNLNKEKFWQIFQNLIVNAVKFTPRGGRINLTLLKENPKYCLIVVEDNGIGISESKIPILFDRFTKASRRGTEGESTTGLGLSIVKRLVELHKGEIWVESQVENGTRFFIRLPLI